jgi:hypothetical protein
MRNPEDNTFRWVTVPPDTETGSPTKSPSDRDFSSQHMAMPSYKNAPTNRPLQDLEPSDSEHEKGASTADLDLNGSQLLVTKKNIKKEKKAKKGKRKKSSRILDGCENGDSSGHVTLSEVDLVDSAAPMTVDKEKKKKDKKKTAKKKRPSALDMSPLPSSAEFDLSMTRSEINLSPHQSDTDRLLSAEMFLDETPLPLSVRESETMQNNIDDRKSSYLSNEISTKRKTRGKAGKTKRMEENTAEFPSPQQHKRLYHSDTFLSHQNDNYLSHANRTKQAARMLSPPLKDDEEVQSRARLGLQKQEYTHQNPSIIIPKAAWHSENRLQALQWASSSLMPSFQDAIAALRPPPALETEKMAKRPSELRKQDMGTSVTSTSRNHVERQHSLAIDSLEMPSSAVDGSLHLSDIFDVLSRPESSRGFSPATGARGTDLPMTRSNSRSAQLGHDGRMGPKSQQPASHNHLSIPKKETARIDEESQRPIPLFEARTPEGGLKEVDGYVMVTLSQRGNEAKSSAKRRLCFGVLVFAIVSGGIAGLAIVIKVLMH